MDDAALLPSEGVKGENSQLRDSRGSVFSVANVVVFINSAGCLLPVSAVHRLLDRPLPCTKDFSPSGFR